MYFWTNFEIGIVGGKKGLWPMGMFISLEIIFGTAPFILEENVSILHYLVGQAISKEKLKSYLVINE